MPIIQIQSLPQEPPIDVSRVLTRLSQTLASECNIDLQHISAIWQQLAAGHYLVGGRAADGQPASSHPVLVNISIPDIYSQQEIERIMQTVASSLHHQLPVSIHNIFIEVHPVAAGHVFDDGQIQWFD